MSIASPTPELLHAPPDSAHANGEDLYAKFTVAAAVFFLTFGIGYVVISGVPGWDWPTLDVMGIAFGHDFLNTWMGAKSVFDGGPAAWFDRVFYNQILQAVMLDHTFPDHYWSYPPHVLLFAWPFGLLPYLPAYLLWCVAGVALYVAACWPTVQRNKLLFLAVAPAVAMSVLNGQNGAITAALLIAGLWNLDKRPIFAGIMFGCLTIKPQLGLLLPVLLLLTWRWRVIFSAVATTAVLMGATAVWFGIDIWVGFFKQVMPQQHWLLEKGDGLILIMVPSALYSVRLLRLPLEWAWTAQFIVSACALAAVVWTYWRKRDPVLSVALFLTATILFSPYSLNYDMVVLAWAVALLRERDDNTSLDTQLGLAVWTLPVLMLVVSGVTRLPFAIFVLIAFAARLLWRMWKDEKAPALPGLQAVPQAA